MSELDGSFEFKVIKRIPLSKSISSDINLKKESDSIKRLDKIDFEPNVVVKPEINQKNLDFKPIKKLNFKPIIIDDKKLNLEKSDQSIKAVSTTKDVSDNNAVSTTKDVSDNNAVSATKEVFDNNAVSATKKVSDNKTILNSKNDLNNKKLNSFKKKKNKKNKKKITDFNEDVVIKKEIIKEPKKHPHHYPKKLKQLKKNNIVIENNSIKKDIYFDKNYDENKSTEILKNILENMSKYNPDDNNQDDFFKKLDNKQEDINLLLDQLNQKTNKLNEEEVSLETFSFLGDKPEIKKIKYDSYNIKNLYSKLDSLNKKDNLKEENNNEKSLNLDILKNNVNNNLLEEIEIPDIYAIKDDVSDIDHIVENNFIEELKPDVTNLNPDSRLVSVVKSNEALERIPNFVINNDQLKLNSEIEKKIIPFPIIYTGLNSTDFYNKINIDDKNTREILGNINLTKEDDIKIQEGINNLKKPKKIDSQEKMIRPIIKPTVKTDLISERFNDLKEKGVDYILPRDVGGNKTIINKERQHSLKKDSDFSSLVYNDPIIQMNKDITKVYEKYSIDDFTYVTIYYDNGLFYNIVQPELTFDQEKEYLQIKKIFFNTIDKDYYSFNGDKHSLNRYIEKIYDISIDKLSYNINNLQKKLYLKFIQREFFGLGILTNLLQDKKIIEVSCSGEKSNVLVNHIDYGILKTNISFDSISELNKFIIVLTKNMGLFVTQTHPVIDGYLPNGYKVEGLYSMGDTSSKGSSFVIKKYLDQPLTPISLLNTSIGSIDVFSYIWSAISEDYKVIVVDTDDSFVIFNSLLLFYPSKKIITIQSYDRLKLPQKEWINRIFTNNPDLNKRLMINQTISQKPDYIIVDEFNEDIFDISWYNLNMFSITPDISSKMIEKLKSINQKAIFIELNKVKQGIKENLQIVNIKEIVNQKENLVVDIDIKENNYIVNLLASSLDVVNFLKRKKIMRWMVDSNINNFKDFNSIVSEFYFEKENLFKRLDIK